MAKFDKTVTFFKPQRITGTHHAIVFIHGGAWIDKNNTPNDFAELSQHILNLTNAHPSFSMYAIEYRLSPEAKHPDHIVDVIDNLAQLIAQEHIEELTILGHSVGATLAWQLLSSTPCLEKLNTHISADKYQNLRNVLRRCYLVDGIYSLTHLLEEYPSYDYFISQAFLTVQDYDDPRSSTLIIPSNLEIHVIHSYEDELLSPRQSNYLCQVLQDHKQPYYCNWDHFGKHNDVYSSTKLAQYILYTMR